jgi:hypothetical protein
MRERLGKARRVLAVQSILDRLADWRLRDLEARELALQDDRRKLVQFVESESAFAGLFAAVMMRRIQGLEDLRAALTVEKASQQGRRLEERGRMRRAERIVEALESEGRRLEEARRLAEATERAAPRRT